MATKDDKPVEADRPTQRAERGVTTGTDSGTQPQEQPAPLSEVMAHEVTPGMPAKEREERGAEPADRAAEAHRQRSHRRTHTVLRQIIHHGETHHPGAEIELTDVEASPLIDTDSIVPGVAGGGDEEQQTTVKRALGRHREARRRSLTDSGIPAPPVTPADEW
jgi:hypothetical protein